MRLKTAPGAPGVETTWTSAAKDGIGKALSANSFVSFTISHGILNEVYYPREDVACMRDMEFVITDGEIFFSEENRWENKNFTVKITGKQKLQDKK